MKLLRFVNYDICEGIIRFWKKYFLVIILGIIVCTLLEQETASFLEMWGKKWSPLEYGVYEFWGRYPYQFNVDNKESFVVPFSWIIEYLLLAYCIGGYISEDMRGFGANLIVKSKSRILWWGSKCIWCILVNVLFFLLLWCTSIGYAWIISGNAQFDMDQSLMALYYGNVVASTSVREFMILAMIFPLLVGLIQSLFQMILSFYVNSATVMTLLSVMLVFTSYYANPLLVHGYAMITRYYPNDINVDYKPLSMQFGVCYLFLILFLLIGCGCFLIERKDILEK